MDSSWPPLCLLPMKLQIKKLCDINKSQLSPNEDCLMDPLDLQIGLSSLHAEFCLLPKNKTKNQLSMESDYASLCRDIPNHCIAHLENAKSF